MSTSDNQPAPFIPVRRSFWGELVIFGLARRSLYKSFHAVRFRAAGPLPAPPGRLNVPIIFYANHNTWWDGYLAHIVMRQVYGLEPHLMMDLRQLRRYWYLSWAGCFSVDQTNGRAAMRSIEYACQELTKGPGRALWIYPQGEIVPQERRPLDFHSGLARLIRRLDECYVYPVAVRFEFFGEQYPEILVEVGPARYLGGGERKNEERGTRNEEGTDGSQPASDPRPPTLSARQLTADLEADLTARLDALRQTATNGPLDDSWVTIIRGKGSTDTLVDKIGGFFRRSKKG